MEVGRLTRQCGHLKIIVGCLLSGKAQTSLNPDNSGCRSEHTSKPSGSPLSSNGGFGHVQLYLCSTTSASTRGLRCLHLLAFFYCHFESTEYLTEEISVAVSGGKVALGIVSVVDIKMSAD